MESWDIKIFDLSNSAKVITLHLVYYHINKKVCCHFLKFKININAWVKVCSNLLFFTEILSMQITEMVMFIIIAPTSLF